MKKVELMLVSRVGFRNSSKKFIIIQLVNFYFCVDYTFETKNTFAKLIFFVINYIFKVSQKDFKIQEKPPTRL
jgi:hypothetical protein